MTTLYTPSPAATWTRPKLRRPSLARLTVVELRKSIDTRAGRWVLVVIVLMAGAGLGYRLLRAEESPVAFETYYGTALTAVQQLLPVLGVLAMTTEWSQRTALTTFTLIPQRGRVITAKLAAALVLTSAMVVLLAAAASLAVAIAGAVTSETPQWGNVLQLLLGALGAVSVYMLMGAALGALLQQTPAALVAYFIAPPLVSGVAAQLLGDGSEWVDLLITVSLLSRLELSGHVGPVLTAVALWVWLPLAIGVTRTLRRQIT